MRLMFGCLQGRKFRAEFFFIPILIGFNLFFLWPFWGKTYPQVTFSGPLVPLLAKILDFLIPLGFWEAVGILVTLSFPLLSFSWYLFLKKFNQSSQLAFLTSLIFLLPLFLGSRIELFWQLGDGAHVLVLALFPLVAIPFWQFLRVGSFNFFFFSFLGAGLVALISPFGFLNLVFFFGLLTISEMLLGRARIKLLRFLVVLVFSLGAISFWYHPQVWVSLRETPQGAMALSALGKLIPISLFTVPVLGAFSFLLFDRKPGLQPLFLAGSLTLFYLVVLASERFGGNFTPMPDRFSPELQLAVSFLAAVAWGFLKNVAEKGFLPGVTHPRLGFLHHPGKVLTIAIFAGLLGWPIFSLTSLPLLSPSPDPQVLGVQISLTRGGVSAWLGYGTSGLTFLASFFLKRMLKT